MKSVHIMAVHLFKRRRLSRQLDGPAHVIRMRHQPGVRKSPACGSFMRLYMQVQVIVQKQICTRAFLFKFAPWCVQLTQKIGG